MNVIDILTKQPIYRLEKHQPEPARDPRAEMKAAIAFYQMMIDFRTHEIDLESVNKALDQWKAKLAAYDNQRH